MTVKFLFLPFIHSTDAPWCDKIYIEDVFLALKSELIKVSLDNRSYNFVFERPFNAKTKYYNHLFYNYACATIEEWRVLINEDNLTQEYWINKLLFRKLKTALKDIGKILKNDNYDLSLINPKSKGSFIDSEHRTDTYIIQNLKYTLIWVYLEVQKSCIDKIEDPLLKEDFFTQLLNEPIPSTFYISELIKIEVIENTKKKEKLKTEYKSFLYNKEPDTIINLNSLRNSLIDAGMISDSISDTNFRKVFENKEITEPIIWTGYQKDLKYFINALHRHPSVSNKTSKNKWSIAVRCFRKEDFSEYEKNNLKDTKPNDYTNSRIDKAIARLN